MKPEYKLISAKRVVVTELTESQEAAAKELANRIQEAEWFVTPLVVIDNGTPMEPRYESAGNHVNSRAAQLVRESDPRKWEMVPAWVVDEERAKTLISQMVFM